MIDQQMQNVIEQIKAEKTPTNVDTGGPFITVSTDLPEKERAELIERFRSFNDDLKKLSQQEMAALYESLSDE